MKNKKIKILFFFPLFLFAFVPSMFAQDYLELPLCSKPDSIGADTPMIRVYLPEHPNGGAVIVCPGGGYRYLEMDKEGYAYAPWFNERGIACIVLKYSLPSGNSFLPLEDAKQAILLVRRHAKEWRINPGEVGVMGSSAGGHVASTLATHFDKDTRPDFQILLYPVITMDTAYTHRGSYHELLGEKTEDKPTQYFSNETRVTPDTPKAFIALSDDDHIVPSVNSVNYYLALKQHNVPCEMHVYATGGHGWGMNENFLYYKQLTDSLELWLHRFLSPDK